MRKNKFILCVLIFCFGLTGCKEETGGDPEENTYTVIWQDDNGDVLEIDRDVKEGTIPTYDGATPTKTSTEEHTYTFSHWSPTVVAIYQNTTYTANYSSGLRSYSVTWKNYDGSILEEDRVPHGSLPIYDGATPERAGDAQYKYLFTGWNPEVVRVDSDATYTARFNRIQISGRIPGVDPVISSDNRTVEYGFYPQSHVNDATLIARLEASQASETNGWYSLDGDYYTNTRAEIYNNESYTFDDGTVIVEDETYWFKCETIKWRVLGEQNGKYFLLASSLLNAQAFYQDHQDRIDTGKTIYANNYEYSNLRTWLNKDFHNEAFFKNNTYINETTVSNIASTTDAKKNTYACSDTKDKVYLPSYQDFINVNYGFEPNANNSSITRQAKTTDFARAQGAWSNKTTASLNGNGSYWTRSPSSEYYYCAWNVNSSGHLSTYSVNGADHSVRPCITITFQIYRHCLTSIFTYQ